MKRCECQESGPTEEGTGRAAAAPPVHAARARRTSAATFLTREAVAVVVVRMFF